MSIRSAVNSARDPYNWVRAKGQSEQSYHSSIDEEEFENIIRERNTFTTTPRQVDPKSFYLSSEESVKLYWQENQKKKRTSRERIKGRVTSSPILSSLNQIQDVLVV